MEEHPQARLIVETLAKAGFVAYYAGGWVRDFLLNHPSDDIDIATNAPPETIQALFPHTVPIGIAFGIILVIIDGKQYEVATFRQDLDYKDGRRPTKISFTTAAEDAKRRDFTINGMFYDPLKGEILDFVSGRADLEKKIIRAIGNPHQRIKEDRLRMIRAIRLSCRFHFEIEESTADAIHCHSKELFPAVAIERVWQEFTKGHSFGKLRPMLITLHAFGLLAAIFPALEQVSVEEIERRLHPLKDYPHKAPLIAFLLPLFPQAMLEEQMQIGKKLKISNLEMQFISFLFHARELCHVERPVELVEWAYFYANSFSNIALQIIGAHYALERRASFLKEHEERITFLAHCIDRVRNHDPVVKSDDLMNAGIQPGKIMGRLLAEADRIAMNQQIFDPDAVIDWLKQSDLWPK
ncbi:MAG TPA: CCA tRNA nucleotidyltransferase [Chlamydiales bacterium]|nr:CCA tRNA nucleotidyltransferase [Chlamydiales bacterium]